MTPLKENLTAAIIIMLVLLFGPGVWYATKPTVHRVCGTVERTFSANTGLHGREEAHVVLHADSLGRSIDVEVTWTRFANTKPGDRVCYYLPEYLLR